MLVGCFRPARRLTALGALRRPPPSVLCVRPLRLATSAACSARRRDDGDVQGNVVIEVEVPGQGLVTWEVTDRRSLEAFLNVYGCGGGALFDLQEGKAVADVGRLHANRRYKALAARSKKRVDAVLVESKGERRRGHFTKLTQSVLDRFLSQTGGWGLVAEGAPPTDIVLTLVEQLEDGATYVVCTGSELPLKQQVDNLQASESRRLEGHEKACDGALRVAVARWWPGSIVKRTFRFKKYGDGNQDLVELDAGIVVSATGDLGSLDDEAVVGEHKQTASVSAVDDAASKAQLIAQALPRSPDLPMDTAFASRLHIVLVADTWAPNDAQGRSAILQHAKDKGVHVLLRNGAEYSLEGSPSTGLAAGAEGQQPQPPSWWFDLRTGKRVSPTGSS